MDLLLQTFKNISGSISAFSQAFSYLWFFFLPPLLFSLFKVLWMYHIQTQYWLAQDWILLELTAPKNIEKSPKVMEALYAGMAGSEATINPLEMYTQGAFPASFSLELVSDGGSVHFYIRTLKRFRNLVEAHLFAQYPDVEIVEASDYVNDVPKIIPNGKWDLWGCDFESVKDVAYPIRTYEKFKEDVTGKMIDPLAGLVEIMGKLPPGQKLWLQYVIVAASPGSTQKAALKIINKLKGQEKKEQSVFEMLMTDIKDIFSNLFSAVKGSDLKFSKADKKEEQPLDVRLSPGEREILKSVEEAQGKLAFHTKMRMIYLGRRDGFDKALGVSGFIGGIKQFGEENMNGMKPNGDSKTFANYVFTKTRLRYRQRKILKRYRNRNMDGAKMVFNSEELATLFHLPDMQVLAPSITRVEAKRSGAPSNLPIE